jgi:hypothetical protein
LHEREAVRTLKQIFFKVTTSVHDLVYVGPSTEGQDLYTRAMLTGLGSRDPRPSRASRGPLSSVIRLGIWTIWSEARSDTVCIDGSIEWIRGCGSRVPGLPRQWSS